MLPKIGNPWISSDRIEELVQLERIVVILGLALVSWIFYRVFMKRVSPQRHLLLKKDFANLGFHCSLAVVLTLGTLGLFHLGVESTPLLRIGTYLGVFAIFSGALVFVKTCRLFAFEYLFLSHMREGVPVLLVNLLTLFLFLVIAGWAANSIFNVRLAPLLATSAIFSLVLGLALQDTLGNLFAGVALQFDKPYEIGDWIEVTTSGQKWTGRVQEISWRGTVLKALGDEEITVPNRAMAQAEISNFCTKTHPILRSQTFRFPYGTDTEKVRKVLVESISTVAGIQSTPSPSVSVSEAAESFVVMKLFYFIDDFGTQYRITDQVLTLGLNALSSAEIPLAVPRLQVVQS